MRKEEGRRGRRKDGGKNKKGANCFKNRILTKINLGQVSREETRKSVNSVFESKVIRREEEGKREEKDKEKDVPQKKSFPFDNIKTQNDKFR